MEDMFYKEGSLVSVTDDSRMVEAAIDELLGMFNTNKISQGEVDRECELVREELYDAHFVGTC